MTVGSLDTPRNLQASGGPQIRLIRLALLQRNVVPKTQMTSRAITLMQANASTFYYRGRRSFWRWLFR